MRERVFAVLGDHVHGARFLDLFAGTGAVGLEALSRGAHHTVFVENHRKAIQIIRTNRSMVCEDADSSLVIQKPARRAVTELARRNKVFHIAWADPPFDGWAEGLAALVSAFETGVIEDDGIACLECPEKARVAEDLPDWLEVERDLVGGASRVVLLRRRR
jgi:16S rRNA (guanine966-N2)-methyltransferase